jgi:hypothetical protein
MDTQLALFADTTAETQPALAPTATPVVLERPTFDNDFRNALWSETTFGSARQHQHVVDGRALAGPDLKQLNLNLRSRMRDGDAEALAVLASDGTGVAPHLSMGVLVTMVPLEPRPVCCINLATGHKEIDYGQLFTGDGAKPLSHGHCLPSEWIARIPMPADVIEELRRRAGPHWTVGPLIDLVGVDVDVRRKSLMSGEHGRLRSTWIRRANGMSAAAVAAGVDPYLASLVLSDPALVTTSRLYYTRADPCEIHEAAALAYSATGLGEPVPMLGDGGPCFGSAVLPSDDFLLDVDRWIHAQLASARPPRKYTRRQVSDFHDVFMKASAWKEGFCTGTRRTAQFDFDAKRFPCGTIFGVYRDKTTEASGEHRPVVLCDLAQQQLRTVWLHWADVERRLSKLEGLHPSPLLFHARAVLSRQNKALFAVEREDATMHPIGTHDIAQWIPEDKALVPNVGRHFWQTRLRELGATTRDIDVFARHARIGAEAMSSITLASWHAARVAVTGLQDAELSHLGVTIFKGLGS